MQARESCPCTQWILSLGASPGQQARKLMLSTRSQGLFQCFFRRGLAVAQAALAALVALGVMEDEELPVRAGHPRRRGITAAVVAGDAWGTRSERLELRSCETS